MHIFLVNDLIIRNMLQDKKLGFEGIYHIYLIIVRH